MKIAIAASGQDRNSQVEARFVRCPYFLIIDTDTMNVVIRNEIAALTKDCFELYGLKMISIAKHQDTEQEAITYLKN